MAINNKEPIEYCNMCRFEINSHCRRNPPTAMWCEEDGSFSGYPRVTGLFGCFAGELRENDKNECCYNCAHGIKTIGQELVDCSKKLERFRAAFVCDDYEHE